MPRKGECSLAVPLNPSVRSPSCSLMAASNVPLTWEALQMKPLRLLAVTFAAGGGIIALAGSPRVNASGQLYAGETEECGENNGKVCEEVKICLQEAEGPPPTCLSWKTTYKYYPGPE